jgi:hypothetical protein
MSSKKTLLLPLVNEILLKEIGEANITPLNWSKQSENHYKFLVDINDYTEVVDVLFDQVDEISRQFYFPSKYRHLNHIYNIGFTVSGTDKQYAKSTISRILHILSTVVDIVKSWESQQDDLDGFFINPVGLDSQMRDKKSSLYLAYLHKQLEHLPDSTIDWYRDGIIVLKN